MKNLITAFILITLCSFSYAQNRESIKRIEAAKIALITERLELTPSQAEKFWPVYNEFTDKRRELRRSFEAQRKQMNENDLTEEEHKALINEGLSLKQDELNLEKEYAERFMNIISAEQILALHNAEQEFKRMLLRRVQHNQNRQNPDLKLFEFGKTYHKFETGYSENRRLIIAVTGLKQKENWNSSKEAQSFYSIKSVAGAILQRLGMDGLLKSKGLKNSLLQDGLQLQVLKNKVGEIGWVSSKFKMHFGIKNDVFIADLDWDGILDSVKFTKVKYAELPKTFAVRRDFSLMIKQETTFAEIEEVAKSCDKKLLKEVGLFDVYEGDKLEAGKKSYAVSFKFQDAEQTLKDKQVDAVMEKIRASLESKLGAQLRG